MSNLAKRDPPLPSGDTPGKKPAKQRREGVSKKALFQSVEEKVGKVTEPAKTEWGSDELSALVEFIALYHNVDADTSGVWPTHKRKDFWDTCAKAIHQSTGKKERTGKL